MSRVSYLLAISLLTTAAFAQTATLRGQVTDESGAIVQGAKIVLSGPGRLSKTSSSGNDGSYSSTDLPVGNYTVHASAPGLAGPAAGPNGGSIFIDGFSGGELPPKNAIREIRINQNPFSPEYDKLGFGRIEIFTKPGTDKFRGSVGYNFANDKWNSRNAYAAEKAPFRLSELSGTLSGPINRKASFNLNLIREWVDNGNAVHGVILHPRTLVPTAFTATSVAALRRTGFTPRVDHQL